MSASRRLTLSERLFALLLHHFPSDFRLRFGQDMREVFSDQLRGARRSVPRRGECGLWLRVLPSLLRSAALEWRGYATVRAVTVLRDNGIIEMPTGHSSGR